MISKLHLKKFIVFTDLSIDFSQGINIVIGDERYWQYSLQGHSS